jgi:RNA polymerase sigma-70 factor (ECF subfamily)
LIAGKRDKVKAHDWLPDLLLPTVGPYACPDITPASAGSPTIVFSSQCNHFMSHTSYTKGTEAAYLAAYDEHADGIFRFIVSKISDREMAHDLVQETFTRVWDYCAEGGEVLQWKPFLFRTAYNLIVDHYRKKRSVSLDALMDEDGFIPADTTSISASDESEHARIRAHLRSLDDTYRDILMLRYIEDMPVRDIATALQLSENVVSVRIHRGIKILREKLHVDPIAP